MALCKWNMRCVCFAVHKWPVSDLCVRVCVCVGRVGVFLTRGPRHMTGLVITHSQRKKDTHTQRNHTTVLHTTYLRNMKIC